MTHARAIKNQFACLIMGFYYASWLHCLVIKTGHKNIHGQEGPNLSLYNYRYIYSPRRKICCVKSVYSEPPKVLGHYFKTVSTWSE